jgi:hypothetical protein
LTTMHGKPFVKISTKYGDQGFPLELFGCAWKQCKHRTSALIVLTPSPTSLCPAALFVSSARMSHMTEIPQPPSENVSVSSSTRSELGFRHPVFLSSISNEFKEQTSWRTNLGATNCGSGACWGSGCALASAIVAIRGGCARIYVSQQFPGVPNGGAAIKQ